MPWQQYVADVGLELNPDRSLVYSEVDLEVGRQEGKTELKFVIAVMRLTAMVVSHGDQRATYTMQNRKKARTRLERDYAPRLRAGQGFKEIPAQTRQRPRRATEWRLGMNSGVEAIQFGRNSYLQIDTPSRTDGHGDTLDLGLIDEAFAHQDDTVELGMEPAMLTRRDSQLWVLSAAGDAKSSYLWRKIVRGRKLVDQGADSVVAYFEWSADEDDDPGDPRAWARACPAMGYTVREERIEALWRKALEGGPEAIDSFRRAYLCQWPQVPILFEDTGTRWKVIDAAEWAERGDPRHRAGPVSYAVGVAIDQQWASVAASDGEHVEIVANRPGTSWVVDGCVQRGITEITLNPQSPANVLISPLEKAGITVHRIKVAEYAQACAGFRLAVTDGTLRHIDQPELNTAVEVAERRDTGGAWRWSQRLSRGDIAPLIAVTLARYAAQETERFDGPLVAVT